MSPTRRSVSFRTIWEEAGRRGKSIGRILMNEALRQWQSEIRGVVLDLACGREPSYRRILGLRNNNKVYLVGVEYKMTFYPTVVADVTQPLPFKNAVGDVVICSGFLHIGPDPNTVLKEIHRVLKSGGWLLLTTPFMFHHNPEPTDYWRFTDDALQLLLRQSGFCESEVVPIGERFSTVADLLGAFLKPRWLVAPIVYWLCVKLDAWVKRFRLPECPLVYVVSAKKP